MGFWVGFILYKKCPWLVYLLLLKWMFVTTLYGADMSMHRSKKSRNICKVNTAGDATRKSSAFSYEITFTCAKIAPLV